MPWQGCKRKWEQLSNRNRPKLISRYEPDCAGHLKFRFFSLNTLLKIARYTYSPLHFCFTCTCPRLLNFYETHERWNYQDYRSTARPKTAIVVKKDMSLTHETSTLHCYNRADPWYEGKLGPQFHYFSCFCKIFFQEQRLQRNENPLRKIDKKVWKASKNGILLV